MIARPKVEMRVRVVQHGTVYDGMAGFISEIRGRDMEIGKNLGHWVMVWLDKKADGRPTRHVMSFNCRELEREA